MMMTITLTLTEQQGVALRNMLNLAVLHSGMAVAETAVELDNMIVAAGRAAKELDNDASQDHAEKTPHT